MATSQLILHDGPVDLAEIDAGLDLAGTDLVVLSACQTATSSFAASGEALNLATFALRASARSVVASLWDVDDGASTLLMTSLHRTVAKGADPATALVTCLRQLRVMPSDAAAAALADLGGLAADQGELDAIGRAGQRATEAGPLPFDSFHMWALHGFHGLPGPVGVPKGGGDGQAMGRRSSPGRTACRCPSP